MKAFILVQLSKHWAGMATKGFNDSVKFVKSKISSKLHIKWVYYLIQSALKSRIKKLLFSMIIRYAGFAFTFNLWRKQFFELLAATLLTYGHFVFKFFFSEIELVTKFPLFENKCKYNKIENKKKIK